MYIHEGHGWKVRLYKVVDGEPVFTHYLIHPDGGLPGSKGCIVIQGTDAESFRVEIDKAIVKCGRVPVEVRREN
jgi:hypothetical protein